MKPYLIAEWNDTKTEAKGWLCVYNLVGNFAGGGVRMHPSVTKDEVIRLATAMAYKYKAAESTTTGGCKCGIVYDSKKPDAYDVLKRFVIAMRPMVDLGLGIGCDLGTKGEDFFKIFKELGMRLPCTKSQAESEICRKGNQEIERLLEESVDIFTLNDAITGYGVAAAADEAWTLKHKAPDGARVVIQGFGCVGASCAYRMQKLGYKVVGIADAMNLVTCEDGLDVEPLISGKNQYGEMDPATFKSNYIIRPNREWLDVDCDILIPAALEDVINGSTADRVKASIIVEGANIPVSAEGDAIIKAKGIDLVPDFIANMGAIRCFDVLLYLKIDTTTEACIRDAEEIIRKNVKTLFREKEKTGRYQREIAKEIFQPTQQDDFEFTPNIDL